MRTKLIASGVGLVGYGILAGWAFTADRYEAKMKRNQLLLGEIISRQARELEAASEYILRERAEASANPLEQIKLSDIAGGPAEEEPEERPDVPEGETEEETRERLRTAVDTAIRTYAPDDEAVEDFTYMADRREMPGARETPPFVISRVKYAHDEEEGDDYEKLDLTWYPNQRILVDGDQEVIENRDIDSMLGWKNLNRFGDESDDPNVVFIRNRRLETDFEVFQDTENRPPAHVQYGMGRAEYEANQAAGLVRFRAGDV